ncbi:MAG TPA: 50S ribosomal protein L25 [bacterium]|nr:50S ribosomal protein L25 [bacterium]
MERLKVAAEVREGGKKGITRRLRKDGRIPAVLYGRGEKPVNLSLHAKEFTHMMKGSAGTNALIDLTVTGEKAGQLVVMVKDFQTDILRHAISHVDLLKIDMTQKISVKIPVHIVGKAVGVVNGGLIELVNRDIEVRCLPGNIPEKIDVDITPLDIGNSFHTKDLKLPDGVEAVTGADQTIVSIVTPREEVAAPAAEAAPAEGAAAAAPAAGEAGKAEAKPEAKAEGKAEKK